MRNYQRYQYEEVFEENIPSIHILCMIITLSLTIPITDNNIERYSVKIADCIG